MINNMLQTIKTLYSNLDVNTASGKYLDMLCALTNVTRKQPTKSSVYVSIEGLVTNAEYTRNNPLVLLDRSGLLWTCEPFIANENGSVVVLATCNEFGPVKAEVGWIYTTAEMMAGVTITMQGPASIGSFKESDADLRARRDDSLSMRSSTVLEGLTTSLLNVYGIDDVRIYNNDSNEPMTAKDSTVIQKGGIYVIVKKRENVNIDDSIIGSIIYEKKTPGVQTTISTVSSGIGKSFNYPTLLEGIAQTVNWKECVIFAPNISIILKTKDYFVSGNGPNSTAKRIADDVGEYLNSLRISEDIKLFDIRSIAQFADPKYRGLSTYEVEEIMIEGASTNYHNLDMAYSYNGNFNVADGTEPGTLILTIN